MKRKILIVLLLFLIAIGCAGYGYVVCARHPLPQSAFGASSGIPYHPVIAHRGASYWAPEETEPAYVLARDWGVDYLEMDIQRTKDHALIAFHDDTPARTTDVATVFPGREKQKLETFTLDELKRLDAGSWFNKQFPGRARAKFAGLRILTLDEIITLAESGPKRPMLYVETKSPEAHPGYEQEVVDVLKKRGWLERDPATGLSKVLFQSFGAASLQILKRLAPETPRIYLMGKGMIDEHGWDGILAQAKDIATGIGPVAYAAMPWGNGKAHDAGLIVHLYTLNGAWQYRIGAFLGADSFFTDRCDQALRFYGRAPAASVDEVLKKYGY